MTAPLRPLPQPVAVVGAGPGDPELLTLRARRLLDGADVVVHDRLVSAEILASIPPGVRRIDVGKARGSARKTQPQIHRLLVEQARAGKRVVRLKGGDPYVFGRGSEEVDALAAAGLEVEVVPGLSSALTAPLAAGIPVTERGVARSFAVLTVETRAGVDFAPLRRLAGADTLVLLMGAARLAEISRELMRLGRPADLPAAIVERGTQPQQRVLRSTLAELAEDAARQGLRAPMTIVIGEVARSDAGDARLQARPPRRAWQLLPSILRPAEPAADAFPGP